MNIIKPDHDRWFKELITIFFEEFILAFFPTVYEYLDFRHLKFLNQEVYTDIVQGRKGTVDILVETKLKGEDAILIVHVEPQSTYQANFSDRMFFYFGRLYEKFRCPIIPIAVFSYDHPQQINEPFTIYFPFLQVLTFNYLSIYLKKQNWRDYIKQPNPVALALLGKMGYDQKEKVQMKLEFLRMLIKLELDPAREHLIASIFEKYHILTPKEEEELEARMEQIPKDEVNQIMDLMTSWERKGLEKGIQQGITEGKELALKESIRKMASKNLTPEQIASLLDLPVKEIEKYLHEKS